MLRVSIEGVNRLSLTYEQLADLILRNTADYVVVENKDGAQHYYRGSEIESFYARADDRRHDHRVFRNNELVYHRDVNGHVIVGTAEQKLNSVRRQSLGSLALYGVR